MRNFGSRLRKLEQATEQVATAYLWCGYDKSNAELRVEIEELKKKGFKKFIVASWLPPQ
jgi:hypothetical protein